MMIGSPDLPAVRFPGIVSVINVKIDAVSPCMAEYTVEYEPDAACFCLLCQTGKIFIRSERRVYFQIISGIIVMIGCRLEKRIEVNRSNSQ